MGLGAEAGRRVAVIRCAGWLVRDASGVAFGHRINRCSHIVEAGAMSRAGGRSEPHRCQRLRQANERSSDTGSLGMSGTLARDPAAGWRSRRL